MARAQVVVVNLVPAVLVALSAVALWRFFGAVREVLLLLAVAAILAAALHPVVAWARARLGLPRQLAAVLAVAALFGLLFGAARLALPPLASQLTSLAAELPGDLRSLESSLASWTESYPQLQPLARRGTLEQLGSRLAGGASSVVAEIVSVTALVVEVVAALVFVGVLLVYVLAQPEPLVLGALAALPARWRPRAEAALTRVLHELGVWGLSTLALMAIVGVLIGLGLWAAGVENALLYGTLGALGELVPTLGPFAVALPPIVATLAEDPGRTPWVIIVSLAAQQLEGNVLTPMIFGRSVHLHPASVLVGVLGFGSALGAVGALLAVPFLIAIKAAFEELYLPVRRELDAAEGRAVPPQAGTSGRARRD